VVSQPPTVSAVCHLRDHHYLTELASKWDAVVKGDFKEARRWSFIFCRDGGCSYCKVRKKVYRCLRESR